MSLLAAIDRVRHTEPRAITGSVVSLRGLTLLVADFPVAVGSIVTVHSALGPQPAEVVGFEGPRTIIMLLGHTAGVRAGDRVIASESTPSIPVSDSMLGRVVNAFGLPIDDGPAIRDTVPRPIIPPPIGAMRRAPIRTPLPTGVRAIDAMTPIGRGQRLGLFAGPGVGKSTLLAMIARNADSQVNVIAMIGERGREVRDFIDHALGHEGLARSVVVVSTSDESPLARVRAAQSACTIAEHFRDQGKDVLLMLDSITRFAHAQRQIGLAVGEPPATRGYTPSVFAALPVLLERAGALEGAGSITAFYTVLVEGDDMTEPVADAVRGILDGHIILSRHLAQRAHYPAIDVLDSVSRLAEEIATDQHKAARREAQRLLAAHKDIEELLQIGAYTPGSNPEADRAIALKPNLDLLLRQSVEEHTPFQDTVQALVSIANTPTHPRQPSQFHTPRPSGRARSAN